MLVLIFFGKIQFIEQSVKCVNLSFTFATEKLKEKACIYSFLRIEKRCFVFCDERKLS